MMEFIWRYSVEYGSYGGVVYAMSVEDAKAKVRSKYPDGEIAVWKLTNDDYFDPLHPEVWECYGY